MIDEFNEYIFDYTSKISLTEIEEASKKEDEKKDKIRSPYTIDYYRKRNYAKISILIFLIIIVAVVLILIFR